MPKKQTKAVQLQATERTSRGLRNALFEQLDLLRSGEVTPTQARAVASIATQILNSARLEIDMHRYVANNVSKENTTDLAVLPQVAL